MKLPIVDLEVEDEKDNPERVATVHDDGRINAEDPMIEEDIDNCLGPNREAGYRHSSYVKEDGEEVIREELSLIDTGEQGYLTVVSEVLPYPYDVDWDEVDVSQLQDPVPKKEQTDDD